MDRVLLVSRAVGKDEADKLTEINETARLKDPRGNKAYDKRHSYLLHEGLLKCSSITTHTHLKFGEFQNSPLSVCAGAVRPESEVAKAMPASDLAKRQTAAADKKTKMKSPVFFVSPVRLSFRNLSKNVDDRALKSVALRVSFRTSTYSKLVLCMWKHL
jgi:hypothetical protein